MADQMATRAETVAASTPIARFTHLSLFSGIGGLDLAAEWAGFTTVGFVENNPFCQQVLARHWPGVPIHDDITTFDGTQYRGVTLLSGGFPCQPFSQCGKRRGKKDDRYLWPDMLRVITEAQPAYILGENVPNIANLALDHCLAGLEAEGYETITFEVPACGVDAVHRRSRIFIVAARADAYSDGRGGPEVKQLRSNEPTNREDGQPSTVRQPGPDARLTGLEGERVCRSATQHSGWCTEPAVRRVVDGVPTELDKSRLRALGNAVDPHQAYPFAQWIADVERASLEVA